MTSDEILLEYKAFIKIENGMHEGKIIEIKRRETEQGYKYIDFTITVNDAIVDGQAVKLNYSCPENLSSGSKLGKLLAAFVPRLQTGAKYSVTTLLLAQEVKYMTLCTKNKDGQEYTNIVEGSIQKK